MRQAYDRCGYRPTGTVVAMDYMAYADADHARAKRSLWRRALWTLLGTLITLIVFAVVFAQYSCRAADQG